MPDSAYRNRRTGGGAPRPNQYTSSFEEARAIAFRGASAPNLREMTDEQVAQAADRFRAQIDGSRNQRRSGSQNARAQGANKKPAARSSDQPNDERGANSDNARAGAQASRAGATAGQRPTGAGGGVNRTGPPTPRGTGLTGGATITSGTSFGDDSAATTPGDNNTTPPPTDNGPPDIGDILDGLGGTPPDTGADPNTPPGTTPPPTGPTVIARWLPVAGSGGCADLGGFRTADLFLGFESPALVTLLSSDPFTGLRVSGGAFHQEPLGGNTPSTAQLTGLFPCLSQDSFLTLGGASPTFAPGSEPDSADWGQTLNATWFSAPPASTSQNAPRFGDDLNYVWIGRFTAGGVNVAVQGSLLASFVDLVTGSPQAVFVNVDNCPSCWTGADGSLPAADLIDVQTQLTEIPGGVTTSGVVTLSNPAPPQGVIITLASTDPDVASVPPVTVVLPGETAASFNITTSSVISPIAVTLTAAAGAVTLSTNVTVLPLVVASLTFDPPVVTGGQFTTATMRLSGPAPAQGVIVTVVADELGSSIAHFPTNHIFAQGVLERVFRVTTDPVAKPIEVAFAAAIGTTGGVFGRFSILNIPGDLNADGLVNAFDLATLIGSWGPCPPAPASCPADINGDGVVNAFDQATLIGNWTGSTQGGGGPPPTPVDPVIARWVAVDNSACTDLVNDRTSDLYLGFVDPVRLNLIESIGDHTIGIVNGSFHQEALGGNTPPNPAIFQIFPCVEFDSYLTMEGDLSPSINFAPPGPPNASNWGQNLNATWFVAVAGGGVLGAQDPLTFGDARHYVRIGRFTAPTASTVAGAIDIFFVDTAGAPGSARVDVPDWSLARGALDVNGDGSVNANDVAFVIGAIGNGGGQGDLNADGVVNTADLRLLLDAIANAN